MAWLGETWTRVGDEDDHPWKREAAEGPAEIGAIAERPANIVNVDDVEVLERDGATVGRRIRDLGRAAGSRRTGLRHADVLPGKLNAPPHCHSSEEEIFVVLDGDGALLLWEKETVAAEWEVTEHAVRAGSVVARPAGTSVAHAFRGGDDGLTLLLYGTREPDDVCFYPRSGKVYFVGLARRPARRAGRLLGRRGVEEQSASSATVTGDRSLEGVSTSDGKVSRTWGSHESFRGPSRGPSRSRTMLPRPSHRPLRRSSRPWRPSRACARSRRLPRRSPGEQVMAKVIAFANQKGGVAKTTTTLNLGVALGELGHRVLLIDLDPQGNLTMSQGMNPDAIERSMFDVLVHRVPISDVIHTVEVDIAVASIDLAGAELALGLIGRERALEKALVEVRDRYDFVLIDTPPSLGLLTINAFVAAGSVIVPVQCEYLLLRGLVQLENTLAMVRENLNPRVHVEGIVPTMYDRRTLHAREAIEILEEHFGDLVYDTRIRKTVRYAEAPVKGSSVPPLRPVRAGGPGVPRPGEGGARWRGSARACVRARSPSSSARPRRPSAPRARRPRKPSPRRASTRSAGRRSRSRRPSSTSTTSSRRRPPSRRSRPSPRPPEPAHVELPSEAAASRAARYFQTMLEPAPRLHRVPPPKGAAYIAVIRVVGVGGAGSTRSTG